MAALLMGRRSAWTATAAAACRSWRGLRPVSTSAASAAAPSEPPAPATDAAAAAAAGAAAPSRPAADGSRQWLTAFEDALATRDVVVRVAAEDVDTRLPRRVQVDQTLLTAPLALARMAPAQRAAVERAQAAALAKLVAARREEEALAAQWFAPDAEPVPPVADPAAAVGAPETRAAFLARLRADGGDQILQFQRLFLHISAIRFDPLIQQTTGLSLRDALVQCRWYDRRITKAYEQALAQASLKLVAAGFDLDKTYIADVEATANDLSGVYPAFAKAYIRGRGRYGATPHPKSTHLTFVFQQREKPFESRETDVLEWARSQLRQAKRDHAPTPQQLYAVEQAQRIVKPVF
ncbi:hypothetical protein CXG81DRAFT_20815 [Caulochytrium protostelioides]|uniref:Ribosomal protein L22 n=1 Tax=Caulochytrium protostelioides TaxID=1555241 RepID=A0A4P9X232_9FUNG|nr:hypothetical protein CXG81DRAFT_20815 [Caulochytrium protostelioides]|eukprot:RKO99058.1 hypothetical protein CXG81DRAFT_20815 [Caulochytrium protostelioides]